MRARPNSPQAEAFRQDPETYKETPTKVGRLLARGRQGGYVMRIFDLPNGDRRAGQVTIQAPSGEVVHVSYWMDRLEPSYGLSEAEYRALPKARRAALELAEQKLHGFAETASRPPADPFSDEYESYWKKRADAYKTRAARKAKRARGRARAARTT